MGTVFTWWIGCAVLALFLSHSAEARLVKFATPLPLRAWRIAFRSLWAGTAWMLLTAISGIMLQGLFPDQPVYIGSGSWITLGPAISWGAIVFWIATGKHEAASDDPPTATMNGRIDALFSAAGKIVGGALKYGAWAVGGALALLALYLFSSWANSAIEEMPRNSAILLGAIIIAWAVASKR